MCTKGFRDILEIRRGDRDEMYNLFWQPAPPLVPRYLRYEIEERLFADGNVHLQINIDQVKKACELFKKEGVNSIAIAFINSYTSDDDNLDVVVFAAPQLSIMELEKVTGLLKGRQVHCEVSLLIATSPENKRAADRFGFTDIIEYLALLI